MKMDGQLTVILKVDCRVYMVTLSYDVVCFIQVQIIYLLLTLKRFIAAIATKYYT